MPLQIIRQNITKMQVDAIVNPSNRHLIPTGGTDLSVHRRAGIRLFEECRKLGGCPVGSAVITPGFNLPCKYIIHTVGPLWEGGDKGERELLISCYNECLKKAKENNCETVAFPLISSGAYGYPKDKVLKIAISTISAFLFENDMTVYLVVYDKKSYELSSKLFSGIKSYIRHNYIERYPEVKCSAEDSRKTSRREVIEESRVMYGASIPPVFGTSNEKEYPCAAVLQKENLDPYIKLDESFAVKLLKLIDAKGMKDVECYKKANVSKQTWHKLMTDKHYKPNKKTAISFAIALELSLDETQKLLSSVGFVLSDSSLSDVIIKYCLENEIYNVFEIDSVLFKYDQETLFSTV